MIRLSIPSLLASLAILGMAIKANAAPVQLHSRFPGSARGGQPDTQVVDGLLSSAQTLLDQIIADNANTNQKDNTNQGDSSITNDLTTLKGFLSAASELEGAIAGACGSAGSGNGTDASADNSTDASGAGNSTSVGDDSDVNSNNGTVIDTGADSKNSTASAGSNNGTATGDSDGVNNSTAGSGGSNNDTNKESKSRDSKKVVQTGSNKDVIKLRSIW